MLEPAQKKSVCVYLNALHPQHFYKPIARESNNQIDIIECSVNLSGLP